MRSIYSSSIKIALVFAIATLAACSSKQSGIGFFESSKGPGQGGYLDSGTIILSRALPEKTTSVRFLETPSEEGQNELMAPVMGYVPPIFAFVPAENETWLEISRAEKKIVLRRGESVVKELSAEGTFNSLREGFHALQHKEKRPLWYASDGYFSERQLNIPASNSPERYRRGALGNYVLYPSASFPIHSAPVWSDEVGGLRVTNDGLLSIYYSLPIGASIVVE